MGTARKLKMPSPLARDGAVSWYASEAEANDAVLMIESLELEGEGAGRKPELDKAGMFAVSIGISGI